MEKPKKETSFGKFLNINPRVNEETINEIRSTLLLNYRESVIAIQAKVAAMGKHSWIDIEEPEFVCKEGYLDNPCVPLYTYGWKAKAIGRAFTVNRLKANKVLKLHPFKSNVPKRKRGKAIL